MKNLTSFVAGMLLSSATYAQQVISVALKGVADTNNGVSLSLKTPDGHDITIELMNSTVDAKNLHFKSENENGEEVYSKAYHSQKDTTILLVDEYKANGLTERDVQDKIFGLSIGVQPAGNRVFSIKVPQKFQEAVFRQNAEHADEKMFPGQSRAVIVNYKKD